MGFWCFVVLYYLLPFFTIAYSSDPFQQLARLAEQHGSNSTVVDLGYGIYRGLSNSSTNLTIWKGIRFAASTAGENRWREPRPPPIERKDVKNASRFGPICPQAMSSMGVSESTIVMGDEDCLFLNIHAPTNASSLPVLVWVHGGGYGAGNGQQDMSLFINANRNSFVVVTIQYRLGAFGFLSSEEVKQDGVLNAGLLDTIFALRWVQTYIRLFGGDPSRVTVGGESAGAGAIMLLSIAYGGFLNSTLFSNLIAASPYHPIQHYYNSSITTQLYYEFARHVKCPTYSPATISCLRDAPTSVLQDANSYMSAKAAYGTWAFAPVTDMNMIQTQPGKQLRDGRLNGLHLLTSNNALEAFYFVPSNIDTDEKLSAYLRTAFTNLDKADIQLIIDTYPDKMSNQGSDASLFATDGIQQPTATTQSSLATSHQQRAYNIYSEATFICPSYWLAVAYGNSSDNGKPSVDAVSGSKQRLTAVNESLTVQSGYKYQYSVLPGLHGADLAAFFEESDQQHPPDFTSAMRTMWGSFITLDRPSITTNVTVDLSTHISRNSGPVQAEGFIRWPGFRAVAGDPKNLTAVVGGVQIASYPMMNFNITYTPPATVDIHLVSSKVHDMVEVSYPPLNASKNTFRLVDGGSWEGGRAARCEIWRGLLTNASAGPLSNYYSSRKAPHALDMADKIGIGVGVGIGIPVLCLTMVVMWLVRRHFD